MNPLWNVMSESLKMAWKSLNDIPEGEQRDRMLMRRTAWTQRLWSDMLLFYQLWLHCVLGKDVVGVRWTTRRHPGRTANIPTGDLLALVEECVQGGQQKPPTPTNTTVCVIFEVCWVLCGLMVSGFYLNQILVNFVIKTGSYHKDSLLTHSCCKNDYHRIIY